MSDTQWYYAKDNQQQGPISDTELRRLISGRQIAPTDLVWRTGLSDWQPATNFPELFQVEPKQPPIQPPSNPPPQQPPPQQPWSDFQNYSAPHAAAPLPYHFPPAREQTNATTAFILSIVGLFIPCGGFILGIIAIVMSANAMSAMNRTRNRTNYGLAVAALIVGILDLLTWGCIAGVVGFRL